MSYIIAEIGNNHEGDISWAMKAITEAKLCGADAVKFQAIDPSSLVNTNARGERVKSLEKLCLPLASFERLFDFAKDEGIDFGVSFFDENSCKILPKFDFAKVASSDCDNLPLLDAVSQKYDRILVSTGTLSSKGLNSLKRFVNSVSANITILHCISKYPTLISDASLNLIDTLKKDFDSVGYSDHTDSLEINLMALALGADVFEKHFTLDKTMIGIKDHALSSDPEEFKIYCDSIRRFENALGVSRLDDRPEFKDLSYFEIKQSFYMKKAAVAGDTIEYEDVAYQRPRVANSFLSFGPGSKVKARNDIDANQPLIIDDIIIE